MAKIPGLPNMKKFMAQEAKEPAHKSFFKRNAKTGLAKATKIKSPSKSY